MALRPNFPRIAALATIAAIVVALLSMANGEGGPVPPRVRPNPNIAPFQGLGTWVDIYDDSAWKHPAAAVADMAAHGVRTLYLQSSNFSHPWAFVNKAGVTAFVDAAHGDGVRIVAWYLPSFVNVARDAQRCEAAIRFRTPNGNGFDGFALDIEAPDVANASLRSQRLLVLSAELRAFAGRTYPLGAIIPSPRGIVLHRAYWPGFPYAGLAEIYDALMPMSYFTWGYPTADSTHLYITQNVQIIRREVGSDQVPIHVIGGIAQNASVAQAQAFVDALRERGLIGGSYYTYPGIGGGEWPVLQQIPVNGIQTPALPVVPGAAELGNIPGSDTTHGSGVVYAVAGLPGDRTLTYDAFDAQAGEITIEVNWVPVATVDAGPTGGWTGPRQLTIADHLLVDGQKNMLSFVPANPSGTWGVRGVSLTRSGASPSVTPSPTPSA
jgi:hypothetical protein